MKQLDPHLKHLDERIELDMEQIEERIAPWGGLSLGLGAGVDLDVGIFAGGDCTDGCFQAIFREHQYVKVPSGYVLARAGRGT